MSVAWTGVATIKGVGNYWIWKYFVVEPMASMNGLDLVGKRRRKIRMTAKFLAPVTRKMKILIKMLKAMSGSVRGTVKSSFWNMLILGWL